MEIFLEQMKQTLAPPARMNFFNFTNCLFFIVLLPPLISGRIASGSLLSITRSRQIWRKLRRRLGLLVEELHGEEVEAVPCWKMSQKIPDPLWSVEVYLLEKAYCKKWLVLWIILFWDIVGMCCFSPSWYMAGRDLRWLTLADHEYLKGRLTCLHAASCTCCNLFASQAPDMSPKSLIKCPCHGKWAVTAFHVKLKRSFGMMRPSNFNFSASPMCSEGNTCLNVLKTGIKWINRDPSEIFSGNPRQPWGCKSRSHH